MSALVIREKRVPLFKNTFFAGYCDTIQAKNRDNSEKRLFRILACRFFTQIVPRLQTTKYGRFAPGVASRGSHKSVRAQYSLRGGKPSEPEVQFSHPPHVRFAHDWLRWLASANPSIVLDPLFFVPCPHQQEKPDKVNVKLWSSDSTHRSAEARLDQAATVGTHRESSARLTSCARRGRILAGSLKAAEEGAEKIGKSTEDFVEKINAGIDLGTTNSCLAVLEGNRPIVLPNDLGEPITPSIVSIQPDEILIGKKARSRLLTHPANTFVSIKRRMGERYTRTVLGKDYTPESVSALILSHLKEYGERRRGCCIEDAVITVPANFNSIQRQATKDAGEIAGFHVLRVLNEPTAAALAYGHEHQLSAILVVFDLGGGTFDISVVEAGDGLYEVIHSAGDNHLGGDDFNMRIVQWIVQEFQKQTGLDIRRDIPAMCLVHE